MKDYFEYQGSTGIAGSRDAIREAFRRGLVSDGEAWMATIGSRNLSAHTRDEETANGLEKTISSRYAALFNELAEKMKALSRAGGR